MGAEARTFEAGRCDAAPADLKRGRVLSQQVAYLTGAGMTGCFPLYRKTLTSSS
jgi:hypothetical protein